MTFDPDEYLSSKPSTGFDPDAYLADTPAKPSGVLRRAADYGLSALKGAIAIPEAIVGAADIATGGLAGKGVEALGFRPKEAKEMLTEMMSPEQQAASRAVSEAKGFIPTVVEAIKHPSTIAQTVVESAPSALAGGVIGRGVMAVAPKVAPYLAGAVGEGVVGAGSAAEQVRQQTETGTLGTEQIAPVLASGAGTALFGALGGKLAKKFNVADIDTLTAQGLSHGAASETVKKGMVKRIVEGGISEGVFEELPQSIQEQVWQNVALGKPLLEGVPESAAMGMLAGGVMGGGVAGIAGGGQAAPTVEPTTAPTVETPAPGLTTPEGRQAEIERVLPTPSAASSPEEVAAWKAQEFAAAQNRKEQARIAAVDATIRSQMAVPPVPTAETPVPHPNAAPGTLSSAANVAARGSFKQVSELADLAAEERTAKTAAVDDLLNKQAMQRESELESAGGRVAGAQASEARTKRLALLDAAYANEKDRTPGMSFLQALEREFPNAPNPTPEEKQFIAKRESARRAFRQPTTVPTAPNEGGAMGVKERVAPVAPTAAPIDAKIARAQSLLAVPGNRITSKGTHIVNRTGKALMPITKEIQNALQKSSAESVLPRQPEAVGEAGGERSGMGQIQQGAEVARQGGAEAGRAPTATLTPVSKRPLTTPTEAPKLTESSDRGVSEMGDVVAVAQRDYDAAKTKLDAIGPEPRKPSPRARALGSNPSAEDVSKYEAQVKSYSAWRSKYLKLKKAEVETSNVLFHAKRAAPAAPAAPAASTSAVTAQPDGRSRIEAIRPLVEALSRMVRPEETGNRKTFDAAKKAAEGMLNGTQLPDAKLIKTRAEMLGKTLDGKYAKESKVLMDIHAVLKSLEPVADKKPAMVSDKADAIRAEARTFGIKNADFAKPEALAKSIEKVKSARAEEDLAQAERDRTAALDSAYEHLTDDEINAVLGRFPGGETKAEHEAVTDAINAAVSAKRGALRSQAIAATNPYTADSLRTALIASQREIKPLLDNGTARIISAAEASRVLGEPVTTRDKAFFNPEDGTIYFIAEHIGQATPLRGLIQHEVAVHAYQLGRTSAEFKDILRQVEAMKGAEVEAARKRVPSDTPPEHHTEEVLAYLVQNNPTLGIVKRFVAWFRNMIRAMGWKAPLSVNDLTYMADRAMNGGPVVSRGGSPMLSGAFDGIETPRTPMNATRKTITVDGVERPAQNSNGKPIHWSEEGTRNFWRWFGDSKIVDKEGRPLVVYHGSPKAGFSEFDTGNVGAFFSNRYDIAASYAGTYDEVFVENGNVETDDGQGTYDVFLAMKNPKFLDWNGKDWGEGPNGLKLDEEANRAKRDGHDGLIVNNVEDTGWLAPGLVDAAEKGSDVYIAFDPTQIKSATGNVGTFDRLTPSVLKSVIRADGYTIIKDPERQQAENLIARSESGDLRGIRDPKDGSLYVWDAYKATHQDAAEVLGIDRNKAERLIFSAKELKDLPPGVFSDERGYRVTRTALPEPTVGEAKMTHEEFQRAFFSRSEGYGAPMPSERQAAFQKLGTVGEFLGTLWNNDKSLSPWMKSVGTQYHTAAMLAKQGKYEFKRVFDKGQDFLNDVSTFALKAENLAPTLFPRLKKVGDIFKRNVGASVADTQAIAGPLYDGTLNNKVWKDVELVSKFGLNAKQIKLYREALSAVNQSVFDLAKAIIVKHAKLNDILVDREMPLPDLSAHVQKALNMSKPKVPTEYVGKTAAEVSEALAAIKADKTSDSPTRAKGALDALHALREIERIKKTIEDVKAIHDKAIGLRANGYFPLMRFGEHTVTMRDANGEVTAFSMFESQLAANRAAEALAAENPDQTVEKGVLSKKSWKLYGGLNLDALELFAEHTDKETLAPYQEYLRTAVSGNSAMKRMLQRKGTAGFSENVERTVAQMITSNARHISALYNMGDMRKLVNAVPQGDIKDHAVDLFTYLSDANEEAAGLRGFLFFNYIGGSMASAMVNLTQIPMMSAPFLTQFADGARVTKALVNAARMKRENATGDLKAAWDKAEGEGVTAPQEIHQLTAQASNRLGAGSHGMQRFFKAWGGMFEMAESFNRETTFVAAYAIAKENGKSQAEAYSFAKNAVEQTQGIYNKGNRPTWGRGAIGATIFTFKQFSIMYLELLQRMPAKQRMLMLGMLMLAAGGEGEPFYDDITDMIDTIMQWLGYATNTKRAIREGVKGALGEDVGSFALQGASSVLPIDVQGRMSMSNLLPGTSYFKQSAVDKGREALEVLGVTGSLLQNVGSAVENLAAGNTGGVLKSIAPVAVKNAYQGLEMLATGHGVDIKGRKTADVSEAEAAAKMIGFSPRPIAELGKAQRELMQDRNLQRVKEDEIVSMIVRGRLDNDPEAVAAGYSALKKWNETNPELPIRITPAQVQSRIRAAKMSSEQRFIKGTAPELRGAITRELRD